jgi:hypothetical protein
MEVIILMGWNIWSSRNDLIFNQQSPTITTVRRKFLNEFTLVIHREKGSITEWLLEAASYWYFGFFFFCFFLVVHTLFPLNIL